MGEFYKHSRNNYLITRNVEQRLALLPGPKLLPGFRQMLRDRFGKSKEQTVDGFQFIDGEIHATVPRVFREQPRRLMRVFLHAPSQRRERA